jgi:hypothetical protein
VVAAAATLIVPPSEQDDWCRPARSCMLMEG